MSPRRRHPANRSKLWCVRPFTFFDLPLILRSPVDLFSSSIFTTVRSNALISIDKLLTISR